MTCKTFTCKEGLRQLWYLNSSWIFFWYNFTNVISFLFTKTFFFKFKDLGLLHTQENPFKLGFYMELLLFYLHVLFEWQGGWYTTSVMKNAKLSQSQRLWSVHLCCCTRTCNCWNKKGFNKCFHNAWKYFKVLSYFL